MNDNLNRVKHPVLGDVVFHRITGSVSVENQDRIENFLLRNEQFPWSFSSTTITEGTRPESLNQFGDISILNHMLVIDGQTNSECLYPMGNDMGMNKLIEDYNLSGQLIRAQANLFLRRDKVVIPCPHIDFQRVRHLVILYYVNESDGDTIFYNLSDGDDQRLDEIEEWRRESPNRGDILIFDGRIYHSPSCPVNHECRSTLNFDMLIQEEYCD